MAQPLFSKYAGTLIANGEDATRKVPMFNLEEGMFIDPADLPATIDGLMPKLTDIIIHPTMVYNEPNLDGLFVKRSADLGYGFEEVGYLGGALDKKSDGTCKQIGTMALGDPSYHGINYAVHEVLEIFDDEFKKSVLSADQVSSLIANKLQGIAKTKAQKLRLAERQVISDVIDGTRSIASNTQSDGNGDSVTYAPTVVGYAGKVYDAGTDFGVVKGVEGVGVGYQPVFDTADAVAMLKGLKQIGREIAQEGTDYNLAGREVFAVGKPTLTIESKVMDALNYALMDGDQHKLGYSSNGAVEFLQDAFEVKPIDAFAALPTNAKYSGKRLGAVISTPGVFNEVTYYDSMESDRCMGRRSNIYDYQARKMLYASTQLPTACVMFDVPVKGFTARFYDSDKFGAKLVGSVNVADGATPVEFTDEPEPPAGYVFAGYEDALGQAFVSGTTVISADTNFFATYEADNN